MEKKKRPNSNQLGITNFFSKILKKSAENFDQYKTIAENSHEGIPKIKTFLEKGGEVYFKVGSGLVKSCSATHVICFTDLWQ